MKILSQGNIEVLDVDGDIHIKKVQEFQDFLEALIQKEALSLILNMKEVQYINSAGLGAIANSVINARKNNKELVIAEISDPVREIFDLVKFDKFIKLFLTHEEALAYFSQKNGLAGEVK